MEAVGVSGSCMQISVSKKHILEVTVMQTGVRRVVLVGTGFVGMSFAYSMLNQGGIKWISGLEHMKTAKLQML